MMSNFREEDIFHDRYELIQYLGGGELSEVWRSRDKLSGIEVALKIYVRVGEAGIRQFIKDFTLTESLNYPYILKPSHVDVSDHRPYLILKYCQNGPVSNRIDNVSNIYKPFDEKEIALFMYQIAGALDFLHKKEIIHRDVKPDNILIDDNGDFLLTDFGISKKVKNTLSKATSSTEPISFSRPYAPPEVLTLADDPRKDIFSLGVTMYELLTENLPFGGNGGTALLIGGTIPDLPSTFSPELNAILRLCMSQEADKRPSAEDLISFGSGFLTTGKWPVIKKKRDTPKRNTPQNLIVDMPESTSTTNTKVWAIAASVLIIVVAILSYFFFFKKTASESSIKEQASVITDITKTDTDTTSTKPATVVEEEKPIITKEQPVQQSVAIPTAPIEKPQITKNAAKPKIAAKVQTDTKQKTPIIKEKANLTNKGILQITSNKDAKLYIDEQFYCNLLGSSPKKLTLNAQDGTNNYKVYLIRIKANGEEINTSVMITTNKTTIKSFSFD